MLSQIDHLESGLKRLTSAYKNKDNVKKVLSIYLEEINELENAIFQVKLAHEIANSHGEALDSCGRAVGAKREKGQNDVDYRRLIYATIGQNTSEGQPEKIKSIYALLTRASRTQYSETTTGFSIYTEGEYSSEDFAKLFNALSKLKMAGKRIEKIGKMYGAYGFAFAGSLPGKGFGEGKLAHSNKVNHAFRFKGPVAGRGFKSYKDPYQGGGFA